MIRRLTGRLRNTGGFSLLEVIAAIAVTPLIAAFAGAVRLNAAAEEMMQNQLAVTGTVDRLMAEGIDPNKIDRRTGEYGLGGSGVKATAKKGEGESGYVVTVTCGEAPNGVTVETYIRER